MLTLRPSGCTVPSWNICLISSCLRRMLGPRHKRIPRTWTSVILWPAELKCCVTGNRGVGCRCCCVRFANAHQFDSWDFAQFRWCRYGSICGRIYSTQDFRRAGERCFYGLVSVRGRERSDELAGLTPRALTCMRPRLLSGRAVGGVYQYVS